MQFDAAQAAPGYTIQSYGAAGFTVGGTLYAGNLLISANFLRPFTGVECTPELLAPLLAAQPPIEVLLLGTGAQLTPVPADLRQCMRARGIAVDAMDTGAACRTYAILHSEGRRVGAALQLP